MLSERAPFALCGSLGLLLALSGCATSGGLPAGQDNFGEAYRQTLAAQIIDPAPDYSTPRAEVSGAQVAGAIERLRTGKVKQPAGQGLSTIGRQGSGPSSAPASPGN